MGKRRGEWDPEDGLCASVAHFSLHANVYCAPEQRDKLEKLCRYVARPAVAEERLKKPYSDGTSHLVFSPLEFLEKLSALVPPPRAHLTRFYGVLAPHSKLRSKVVPKKARMSWAKLLKRVFGIDMECCGHCGGKMEILAAIMEGAAIEKILKHLGRPCKPPDIAPARHPEKTILLERM